MRGEVKQLTMGTEALCLAVSSYRTDRPTGVRRELVRTKKDLRLTGGD